MFGLFGSSDFELASDGELFTKLREFIARAEEDILLIAPYVDPSDDLVRVLQDATLKVGVEIWFRADKVDEYRGQPWFRALSDSKVLFRSIKNLHSKLYIIDDQCIVSSMNLTKSSWNNSREFGCVVGLDSKYGDKITDYVESLGRESVDVGSPRRSETKRHWHRKAAPTATKRAAAEGFCIRCGDSIVFDVSRPYCKPDYERWAEYKNPNFKDKQCHKCGKPTAATMSKPLCRDCFSS